MTPAIARGGWGRLRLVALAAILILASTDVRADEWTTYAHLGDQKDLAVVGNTLWIATTGGALVYETTSGLFVPHGRRAAGGPSSQLLTSVTFYQPEGLVFFGSADHGVDTYDVASNRWNRFEFLPDNRIRSISRIDDEVWIATAAGFAVRRSAIRTDLCNEIDRGLCCGADLDTCTFPSFDVRDFEAAGSHLWVATAAGPAENDGSGWRSRRTTGGVTDARSLAFQAGVVFLATPGVAGVYQWDPTGSAWLPAGSGLPARTLGNEVRLVTLPNADDSGTDLWLATSFGVFTWTGSGWMDAGLSEIPVRSLAAVPALPPATGHVIYAATRQGLQRYEGGTTWTALPAPGPPLNIAMQAVDAAPNGVIWIGTLGGAESMTPQGTWSAYRNGTDGIHYSDIYSLFTDSRNRAWLGKCCCPDRVSCPMQYVDDGTPSDTLNVFNGWGIAEGSGYLWIGSNTDGLYIVDQAGSPLATITTASGLNSGSVKAVAVQAGRAILGHETRGLQVLNFGGDPLNPAGYSWRNYGVQQLPDQAVADIALEGNTAWILTAGALHRLQGETLTQVLSLAFDGVPRRGSAVDVDSRGEKWIGTSSGVLRLSRNGEVTVYTTENSDLVADEVLDVAVDPVSGDVLFAARIGTSRLKPGAGPVTPSADLYVYPNPYRRSAGGTIRVGGGSVDDALVTDILGRPVAHFDPAAGWNARGRDGRPVPPGIYLVRVGDETLRLAIIE